MNTGFDTIMKKQIEQIVDDKIKKKLEKKPMNLIDNCYLKKKFI